MSGDYNVDTNLAKNGVGYYFEQNTNVSATTSKLFNYETTYSTSITYDINILGYGNFYCGSNIFFTLHHNDILQPKYPINVNTNLEFNIVIGSIACYSSIPSDNDNYFFNVRGKYLSINDFSLYHYNTTLNIYIYNLNCNINIDVVIGNTSDVSNYGVVLLTGLDYTKTCIKYTSIKTINLNNSYPAVNIANGVMFSNFCNRITSNYSTITVKSITYIKIVASSTIYSDDIGTVDSEVSNNLQNNIISSRYIEQLNILSFGKHTINANVHNLVNNGVNSLLVLNCNSDYLDSVWTLNVGTTILNGEFTNTNGSLSFYDSIQILGAARFIMNATVNITPNTQFNNAFIYINHPNAYVEINNNIYTKNINNVIYLKDGKLKLKGDIQMDGYNNLYNESAIIYDGGEIVMSNSTLKSTLGYEQYPISCINNPKSLKILSGGLNVNKETFDARKQKIEIVVGGTVLSSETYSLALSSISYISYITSGHTTESEVVSGFTSQISALANFTVVNNNNSFTVECNNVSEVFTYNISKTIGTGTMTQRLVRYATYPLTNSTGGTIIIDEDI